MTTRPDERWPKGVYARGIDPDPRFSLANERTFLAWIRTSLGLLATALALEAFGTSLQEGPRRAASAVLLLLALLTPVQAWRGWQHTERALREQRPLPPPLLAGAVSAGVALTVLLVLVGFFAG